MCTRGIRVKQLIIVLIQFTLQYKLYMFSHVGDLRFRKPVPHGPWSSFAYAKPKIRQVDGQKLMLNSGYSTCRVTAQQMSCL
jgi:carboxylesterase type B